MNAVLERIEREIEGGLDVWVDAYPYTAGSSTLATLMPASELNGGEEAFRTRLQDPAERERVASLLAAGRTFALDDVILATVPARPELSGRYLVEVANEVGQAPDQFALELLLAGIDVSMVAFGMSEDDVALVLAHPRTIVASDGWTMATEATLYAHPRNFAYSIRLLARYTRDEQTLALGEAVRKLSAIPAERLGLTDRGYVRPGAVADLVVLDLEALSEESTFVSPCAYPRGVEWVFLAGEAGIADGELTSVRGGRVLLRNKGDG
jgi:N-acyl-D-amino-acid deacylase